MPFTLSHPAAVVAFPKHKYLHKPALIIGSLSPDFIYYLHGSPTHGVGHSIVGTLYFNLPLCMIFYGIYLWLIAPYFWQYLPKFISPNINETNPFKQIKTTLIFALSSIIGSFTHIFWDMFTHTSSDLVKNFAVLHSTWHSIPLYKILQHGSSLLGLGFILLYLRYNSKRNPHKTRVSVAEKLTYWGLVGSFAAITILLWQALNPVYLSQGYSEAIVLIVRLVDAGIVGLLLTGLIIRLMIKKTNGIN